MTNQQPTNKTISDYKQLMEDAWKEVERITRPTAAVRNCQSDLDAEDFAMRKYQSARYQYLEACKMEGVTP